jgi:hypothetical protein
MEEKMKDIIIYTTPKKLLHKQDKLSKEEDDDKSTNGIYYWRFMYLPKEWKDIEKMNNPDIQKESVKIYFATEGFIRGYFELLGIEWDNCGFDIEFRSDSWKDIKPIPITHFQGFKYADKVSELTG